MNETIGEPTETDILIVGSEIREIGPNPPAAGWGA